MNSIKKIKTIDNLEFFTVSVDSKKEIPFIDTMVSADTIVSIKGISFFESTETVKNSKLSIVLIFLMEFIIKYYNKQSI